MEIKKIVLSLWKYNNQMGTNFYRIPTEDEMKVRKQLLLSQIKDMELTPKNIENEFHYITMEDPYCLASPWELFINEMKVHLGKRSGGWKFTWNFHGDKYYSNKEDLFEFIRSGRVVDEYGSEMEVEEFIKMALEWCEPDGHVVNEEYVKNNYAGGGYFLGREHYDRTIDGLNVSASTDFS